MVATPNSFVGLRQTVCWDVRGAYPGGGKVPVLEWMDFLKADVGLALADITEAVQHTITGMLMTRLRSEELFQEALRKAEDGVAWKKHGVTVYGWCAGEEVTNVFLHNVLEQSNLAAAISTLAKSGTVLAKEVHHFKEAPNIKTGVVTVKLRLFPNSTMPSYIYEENINNTIQVFSEKHERVCHRCLGKGHIAAFCKRPRKSQEAAVQSKTWAKIVADSPSTELQGKVREQATEKEKIQVKPTLSVSHSVEPEISEGISDMPPPPPVALNPGSKGKEKDSWCKEQPATTSAEESAEEDSTPVTGQKRKGKKPGSDVAQALEKKRNATIAKLKDGQ